MIQYVDNDTGNIYLFPFLSGRDIDSWTELQDIIYNKHPYMMVFPPYEDDIASYKFINFQVEFSLDCLPLIEKSLARVKEIFQHNGWLDD